MNTELPFAEKRYVLEARDLSVVRGNRVIFRDVNLTLGAGEIVALIGPNGAGKTTLLQCLAGALRPVRGKILLRGRELRKGTARKQIGFVAHESGLYLPLTVLENLLFAGRMWGLDSPEKRATELLRQVGLERRLEQPTAQLSRGMRQRLVIARAVIHDPSVLLLDEPFTSLDAECRTWLTAFLTNLRDAGRAILIATHESVLDCGFVDRAASLGAGGLRKIQFCATQLDSRRSA